MHTLPPFFPHLHLLTPTVAQTNHPNYQQTKHTCQPSQKTKRKKKRLVTKYLKTFNFSVT